MSRLPSTWSTAPFGDLNCFISKTINPAAFPQERFELYSIPVFPSGRPELPLGSDVGSTKQLISTNDVLISKINPRINRVWQVGPSIGLRQIASSEWIGFRCDGMVPRYFHYYFTSPEFRENLCADVTGVGGSLTRAQPARVAQFPIPLAPVGEQKRIADKLDTVLTRVDAVNDRLARVAPLLKRFRQSVLDAATSGRLTEDWRASIGARKDWQITDVQSVADVGTGSTPLRSNPAFFAEGGTPWITSAATGNEIVRHANEHVTEAAIAAHRLKVYPVGTLLVAMYGEGKTRGQVAELGIAATINQACAAVVVDDTKMLRAFVKLALQANYLEMRVLAEGGNQPNLNLAKVRAFPLPLPPMQEQTEIVRRVETLFAFADRLDSRLQAAQTATERLTPSLLAKAFRGELVPQDPNDEPASELLRRLQAQAPTSPAKRGRKRSA